MKLPALRFINHTWFITPFSRQPTRMQSPVRLIWKHQLISSLGSVSFPADHPASPPAAVIKPPVSRLVPITPHPYLNPPLLHHTSFCLSGCSMCADCLCLDLDLLTDLDRYPGYKLRTWSPCPLYFSNCSQEKDYLTTVLWEIIQVHQIGLFWKQIICE